MFAKSSRQRAARVAGAIAVTALLTLGAAIPASAAPVSAAKTVKPTIVLVHGAWADSSSWSSVTAGLQLAGYTVLVPPNPLRSLSGDAAYLCAYLQQATTGPVILVGHSYGGAVVTNAGTCDPDVKALVYVDAFVPDQGEPVLQIVGGSTSALNVDPTTVFNTVAYPGAVGGDMDVYLKADTFKNSFAQDVPSVVRSTLGAGQKPVTLAALSEPTGVPAWKTLPSWYVLGTADKVIPADTQQMMADRAGSKVTKVNASHLSMVSKPVTVIKVILEAATTAR